MKKIILGAVAATLILSNAIAVDISKETSKEKSIKRDTALTNKKSTNKSDTTKSGTSNKSSFDKTANVEVDFYQYLISNPDVNECIYFEKTLSDFGVQSYKNQDYVDVTLQEYYEQISKSNANVSDADMNVEEFKKYLKCIGREGANFAQTITNFGRGLTRQENIKEDELNKRIVEQYNQASENYKGNIQIIYNNFLRTLDKNECIFFGELGKIKCGGVAFSFPDNTLKFGELTLTSPQNFYGVTGKMTVAISTSEDKTREQSNETQIATNKESSLTKTKSVGTTTSGKKSLSTSSFTPKD